MKIFAFILRNKNIELGILKEEGTGNIGTIEQSNIFKPPAAVPSQFHAPCKMFHKSRNASDADMLLHHFSRLEHIPPADRLKKSHVTAYPRLQTRFTMRLQTLRQLSQGGTEKRLGMEYGHLFLQKTEKRRRHRFLAQRQMKFIQHLQAALVRIENKTYGICRETGKLIPKERLRAVPHATLSIEAKASTRK